MNNTLLEQFREAARGNILDRAIGAMFPVWGARRMHARTIMAIGGGFTGASRTKREFREWRVTTNAADLDILPDLQDLRDRSRDLVRNEPIATGAMNTVVQDVVGTGLVMQSRPDADLLGWDDTKLDEFTTQVEREFRLWAESQNCDITRKQNFYQLQALAFAASLESGDVIALLPMKKNLGDVYGTKVQIIEADRLANDQGKRDTDTLAAGVELDAVGAPIAYHIRDKHPNSNEGRNNKKSTKYDAFGKKTGRRNVVHLFERKRPGQNRGIPYFAPVIQVLKQLGRYSEAELMAAVVSSFFTVFVTTPNGEGIGTATTNNGDAKKSTDAEITMGHGSIVDLRPGEDVKFPSSARPSQNFDPFVQAILRQVGVALGIPFEVLIKHFTASYSAARAALLEAWKFYRGRRAFLAQEFCQPIFEAWMDEAVASGRVPAPGYFADPALRKAYSGAEWVGDAMPQIDPEKEVGAAIKRIDGTLSTRADETMQLTGKVWKNQVKVLGKEQEQMKAAGVERMPAPGQGAPAGAPGDGQPNQDTQETGDLETQPAPQKGKR